MFGGPAQGMQQQQGPSVRMQVPQQQGPSIKMQVPQQQGPSIKMQVPQPVTGTQNGPVLVLGPQHGDRYNNMGGDRYRDSQNGPVLVLGPHGDRYNNGGDRYRDPVTGGQNGPVLVLDPHSGDHRYNNNGPTLQPISGTQNGATIVIGGPKYPDNDYPRNYQGVTITPGTQPGYGASRGYYGVDDKYTDYVMGLNPTKKGWAPKYEGEQYKGEGPYYGLGKEGPYYGEGKEGPYYGEGREGPYYGERRDSYDGRLDGPSEYYGREGYDEERRPDGPYYGYYGEEEEDEGYGDKEDYPTYGATMFSPHECVCLPG